MQTTVIKRLYRYDMDVTTLNKRKVDEIIRNFHNLVTRSTEKTCLSYDNLNMYQAKMKIEY